MCGIAGYLALSDRVTPDPDLLNRMLNRVTHRGPDSAGSIIRDRLALGFRRLNIIDPEHSPQPILNEDESMVLACNGEIFNYLDLRKSLGGKGHLFRTNGDVETLVHLYEECGTGMFERVNGQFAFALYDLRRHRLLLARDHFGICPLFYFQSADVLVFASEIKALLEHPLVPREVDPAGAEQIFSMPAVISPTTMFRGIRSLCHGSFLSAQSGGVCEQRYWDLDYPLVESGEHRPKSASEHVEHLLALLRRSVELRLQADVDVGVYLSGGLDSSVLAALMHRAASDSRRHSFSVSIPGNKAFCESRYQAIASRHSGTIHHDVPMNVAGIARRLRAAVRHSECPLRETYNTASLALSEQAREHGVPVVLCGEGADELFAGYDGYIADYYRSRQPGYSRAAIAAQNASAPWSGAEIAYHHCDDAQRTRRSELFSPAFRAALRDCPPAAGTIDSKRLAGRHPIHQRSYLDFVIRLSGHLLADHGDRMAMANSVEARYPFLDIDLINFVANLPPETKFDGINVKVILRECARGLVANEILKRHKFPFSTPGSPELLRCNLDWIEDLLSPERIRREGYFSPDAVARIREEYLAPDFELNVSVEEDWLLLVLTFGLWLEEFRIPALN